MALTYDKSTSVQTMYLDGNVSSVLTLGGYGNSNGQNVPLLVGGIDGCLDDVRLYDYALEATDIEHLSADRPPALQPPEPFLSFPLDGSPDDIVTGATGTLGANITPTTDRFGDPAGAYNFAGETYITIDEPSNLDDFDGISISVFMKQSTFQTINTLVAGKWSYNQFTEQYGLFVVENDHLVAIGRADRFGSRDTADQPLDTWVHAAMTYDKATGRERTFANGELILDRIADPYGNSNGTVLPLLIGGITGDLDDVQLFPRELTPAEVILLADDLAI